MASSLNHLFKLIKGGKSQRRIYLYKVLNKIARRNGWRLYSPRFSPWEDEEYNRIISLGEYPFNDKKFMIFINWQKGWFT
ncbi:MAG: hypothetical protein AAFO82_14190 [Bacteroidota bacterium]